MKPEVRTRRERILGLPDFWRKVYCKGGDPAGANETLARLEALDLQTATREEVNAAIDVSWATKGHSYTEMICDGCGHDVEALVSVGDDNDGRGFASLCRVCVADALSAFEPQN